MFGGRIGVLIMVKAALGDFWWAIKKLWILTIAYFVMLITHSALAEYPGRMVVSFIVGAIYGDFIGSKALEAHKNKWIYGQRDPIRVKF